MKILYFEIYVKKLNHRILNDKCHAISNIVELSTYLDVPDSMSIALSVSPLDVSNLTVCVEVFDNLCGVEVIGRWDNFLSINKL